MWKKFCDLSSNNAVKDWWYWFATFEKFPQSIEQYAPNRQTMHLYFVRVNI